MQCAGYSKTTIDYDKSKNFLREANKMQRLSKAQFSYIEQRFQYQYPNEISMQHISFL